MVPKSLLILSLAGLALPASDRQRPGTAEPHGGLSFEVLSLHLEVDLPTFQGPGWDEFVCAGSLLGLPAEIVLEVESAVGVSELRLSDAGGRTLLAMTDAELETLEVSELTLEVERSTLAEMLAEFPAGEYRVEARTRSRQRVMGNVALSHDFPGLFTLVQPRPGAILGVGDSTLRWSPSKGAARYLLEIEQDDTGFSIEMALPATRTSVSLPLDLLEPGAGYEFSLVAQGDTDNEIEIEGAFVMHRKPTFRR